MTGNLIRQDNTYIGEGAPVTGDEITTNTALCGLNTFYIDKTNGASYVRTGVNKVTGDWTQIGGGSSYFVYTVLLEQNSTNAPVPTPMGTPTIVGTPVWSYNAEGDFSVTLAGAFPVGRTIAFITVDNLVFNAAWQHVSEDVIKLFTFDETWTGMNNFNKVSFEIRVYPA